jgi:uncharacterized lipoprotein
MKTPQLVLGLVFAAFALGFSGCSSPDYKTQGYAKLSNTKEFEEEYPVVWKGVVAALSEYKIEKKDQEKGVVETDWIYSTSNDKYFEYQVNGFPRKKYLQTRYKFNVKIDKLLGRVKVTVSPEEEVESLKSDGSFDDWKSAGEFDTARANEVIQKIEMKILSAPNT